jgi:REP element-mobilizing transposase RayT
MVRFQKFQNKYRITSNRRKDYDYSSTGSYFITICTKNRKNLFGKIIRGTMQLNDLGKIAKECWQEIPEHFLDVVLDEFVVMPNHIHGVLFLFHSVETNNYSSLQSRIIRNRPNGTRRTIGSIIRGFKIGVTKYVRDVHTETNNDLSLPVIWQPNYYDRIIRNEDELNRIREYIFLNLKNWNKDDLNY